jgi:hypothetical protein
LFSYAKPLTKAADPAIAKTERRAILTQQSLTTDVMLTRKLEDSAQGTVLGFFNSDNSKLMYPCLSNLYYAHHSTR